MSEYILKATHNAWMACRDLEAALTSLRTSSGSTSTTQERMAVTFIAESLQAARELYSRLAIVAGE